MKKLSSNVQNLIGASSYVRTFKTAIEELIYNSLDAKSTSIAIRVDIQENLIQVIDNGYGIPEYDFNLLGQKHASSKFIDVATLKSAPCKYGYRGQALAGIIEISKHVKITSRCEQSEETWVKHFHQGKAKDVSAAARRPSKGTTIDIRGFLFNLNIQKKAVDALKEICDIKRFLEQLSLVHNNISISLRDDTKNEVVFKMHKNRELYQTLSILYGINKDNLQELQVEKNKYKVTAYIEKLDQELKQQNWIYLNEKFVSDSKLHKIVNNLFSKILSSQNRETKRVKSNYNDEDKSLFKKKIPFYILFINCPYYDYDINISNSETHLEFKSWDSIKNLLDKLIKFYVGDVKLKPLNTISNSSKVQRNTREEVKKIMNKILGSQNKKLRVSQMQNGIKGRLITRKCKKKLLNLTKPKIKEVTLDPIQKIDTPLKIKPAHKNLKPRTDQIVSVNHRSNQNHLPADIKEAIHELKNNGQQHRSRTGKHKKQLLLKSKYQTKNSRNKNGSKNKKVKRKHMYNNNPIISRFKNEDELIKRNCNVLSKKVEKALLPKKRTKQVFVNETVQYSTIVRNNKNISVRQQIEEIVIHEYVPRKSKIISKHKTSHTKAKVNPKSNYDLINTVLKTQQDNKVNACIEDKFNINNREKKSPVQYSNAVAKSPCITDLNQTNNAFVPRLTYESHRYEQVNTHHQNSRAENFRNNEFISRKSIDNFKLPGYNLKLNSIKTFNSVRKQKPYFKRPKTILHRLFNNDEFSLSSYNIDFSQNIEKHGEGLLKSQCDFAGLKKLHATYTIDTYDSTKMIPASVSSLIGKTYTLTSPVINGIDVNNSKRFENILTGHNIFETYTINNDYDKKANHEIDPSKLEPKNDFDVIFLSKSQNENKGSDKSIYPLDVCATVMGSNDIFDEEFGISFNDNDIQNDTLLNVQTYNNDNNDIEEISSHWQQTKIDKPSPIIQCNIINKKCDLRNKNESNWETNEYNFKNRPRFLPKGMSPIFENSKSKTACKKYFDEECFADRIYDNFANEIQTNTEMYGFGVQNVTDITTKDIDKVNTKMHKDNVSLIFDSESLKTLQVMGQVDEKFIAAKIKGKTNETQTATEFLVLFDQHAVHERVKLEKNMADYFYNEEWRSVDVDDVLLKLSKDQILYLHNYKDKFTQFGLKWTILDSEEIIVSAIPEAVLGKNPRQVEKVIKAVKNLIVEEIETINNQKGCISLFPKAIMGLVFSESCRYAIKFGDRLSKGSCIELLDDLAKCKTPFQCAHGRPVMAVLMEIESKRHEYKINMNKVNSFIKK